MLRKEESLNERISLRRRALGLSVRQAARLVGCSQSTMSRIESGEQLPAPPLLESLAEAMRLELRELYELAGYPLPDVLPELGPYVRMKFKDLPSQAQGEITDFVEFLRARHGASTAPPSDGLDELPEGAARPDRPGPV